MSTCKQRDVIASKLNLSARAVVNGSYSVSDAFGVQGYNQLTLEIFLDYAASTACLFYIETSKDNSKWHRVQSTSTTAGTATCSDLVYSKAIAAADDYWTINIPLNYDYVRLGFTATGGTTDTVTVNAKLGVV